jgi:hypothetical protein
VGSITIEVVIHRRREETWEQLRHLERHVDWMSDARRIDFHSDRREGVGTSFDCVTVIGPFTTTDAMTVTRWRDGESMEVQHRGLFTGTGEFVLGEEDGDTHLTWREEIRFPWWFAGPVGAWIARPVLRRIWRRNLRNFARLVESAPGRAGGPSD